MRSQDFMAVPAWRISSGQIKSGPGDLPGFSCFKAEANSSEVKSSEMPLSSDLPPPELCHFSSDLSGMFVGSAMTHEISDTVNPVSYQLRNNGIC